nr:hypothetical protein [Tanacetum cinerariifolium]
VSIGLKPDRTAKTGPDRDRFGLKRRTEDRTEMVRVRCCHLPRSGPDLVELAGGHFRNRSYDQESIGRDKGDDDGGILSPEEIQRMECELWNLRV